jgi:hypothetical protein
MLSQKFINNKKVNMSATNPVKKENVNKPKKLTKSTIKRNDSKKTQKPINIMDKMDYDAWYVVEYEKLDKEKFNNKILVFKFSFEKEARNYFLQSGLSARDWAVFSGEQFLRKYSFKIIKYRKFLEEK